MHVFRAQLVGIAEKTALTMSGRIFVPGWVKRPNSWCAMVKLWNDAISSNGCTQKQESRYYAFTPIVCICFSCIYTNEITAYQTQRGIRQ